MKLRDCCALALLALAPTAVFADIIYHEITNQARYRILPSGLEGADTSNQLSPETFSHLGSVFQINSVDGLFQSALATSVVLAGTDGFSATAVGTMTQLVGEDFPNDQEIEVIAHTLSIFRFEIDQAMRVIFSYFGAGDIGSATPGNLSIREFTDNTFSDFDETTNLLYILGAANFSTLLEPGVYQANVSGQARITSLLDPQQGEGGYFYSLAARSVPEPGTLALLSIGLAGIGLARRRKKA